MFSYVTLQWGEVCFERSMRLWSCLWVIPRSLEHWSASREEHVEHNSKNRSPWTGKPSLTVWQCFIPLPAGWEVYCRCLCVVRSSVLRIIAVDPDPSRLETCLTLANFWFLVEDMNGISDIMVLHCSKGFQTMKLANMFTLPDDHQKLI
jgi:hypothetical protein